MGIREDIDKLLEEVEEGLKELGKSIKKAI
jgi:hypothetical protein